HSPPLYPLRPLCSPFSTPPATTAISTLSLHDALPISPKASPLGTRRSSTSRSCTAMTATSLSALPTEPCSKSFRRSANVPLLKRSEEHTSELQSRENLVCRLLLEKKKNTTTKERKTAE